MNDFPQSTPVTLDQKISALSPEVDEELRIGLKTRARALRRGDPGEHVVTLLIMARWTLRLLDMLFATVGKNRPSDNAYYCIMAAANGDGRKIDGLNLLPTPIASYLHTIRILSNKADHAKDRVTPGDDVSSPLDNAESIDMAAPDLPPTMSCDTIRLTSQDAETAISAFLRVLHWYYCEYANGPRLATIWTQPTAIFAEYIATFPLPIILNQAPGPTKPDNAPLFVGRYREMETLFTHGELLSRHQGITGFVLGEGGTGKSSLVNQFARRFSEKSPQTIIAIAGCDIASGQGSYAPFKAIMQQILLCDKVRQTEGRDVRPVDIVTEVIGSLGSNDLGPFAAFTGVATELLRCKLRERQTSVENVEVAHPIDQAGVMDWYSQVLRSIASVFPVVIILDDIHWADQSSLLMLLHLARVTPNWPIMIIAVYRPEEIAPNNLLCEVRNQLACLGAFTITLPTSQGRDDPLYPEVYQFCHDYIVARYGRIFSEDLVETLARLSEGNALFLTETLINLEERGQVVCRDGYWEFEGGIAELERLPTRIEAVIGERLERLDDDVKNHVKFASVEGETFTAEVISSLTGEQERDVLNKVIDKLIRRHQIAREAGTKRLPNGVRIHLFRFNHIFTRRYIYDHLLTSMERELLHEDIANSLLSLYAQNVADVAPQLATHYSMAGIHEKTAVHALAAAKTFYAQYGWSEVARFARMGIDALQSLPTLDALAVCPTNVELYLLYAKGELEGGIRGENIDHIQAGISALTKSLPTINNLDDQLVADVYLTLGKLYAVKRSIDHATVNEYLGRALQIYKKLDDKTGIISVLSPHEFDSNLANPLNRTQQLADRQLCLELAEQLDNPILLAKSLNNLAEYYVNFDADESAPLAKAEEYALRSLEIAKTTGNPIIELNSLLMLSWVHHCCGYYGEELQALRHKVLTYAQKQGQTLMQAEALTDLGHYYSLLLDHQAEARKFMRQAYEFRHRMGRHTVNDCEQYGDFLFRQGDFDNSISLFKKSLTTVQDIFRELRTRGQLALISLLIGNSQDCAAEILKIESIMNTDCSLNKAGNSKLMLAYALLGECDKAHAEAKKVSAKIDSLARRGVFHIFTDFPTEVAETYRLLSRHDEARHWITEAARYWTKLAEVTDTRQITMFWEHEFVRGKILADRGEQQRALSLFQDVQAAFEKVRHYLQAEVLLEVGRTLRAKEPSDQSKRALHHAIDLAKTFQLPGIASQAGKLLKGAQT